ncbi:unnamed protein product [Sympodiomycopsis kandeliae]
MTASVVRSPTLSPYDPAVASGSGSGSGSSSQGQVHKKMELLSLEQNNIATKKKSHNSIPRGLDSADVEAQRQEQGDIIAQMHQQQQKATTGEVVATQGQEEEQEEEEDPQGPFEGPEKLLELWFAEGPELLPDDTLRSEFSILSTSEAIPRHGLRAIPRPEWEQMLDIVKCKVLSVIQGAEMDAYLLSESSMFVFPHKIILKTCGTTTLLLGLERLLQLAQWALSGKPQNTHVESLQLGSLARQCFYSRKSFMFPERQKGPHKDWMLEVELLDQYFERGSAYTVGKMNGDHWLLYMRTEAGQSSGITKEIASVERPLHLPPPVPGQVPVDQTLEILMTHLSPSACRRFEFSSAADPDTTVSSSRGHSLGMQLSESLGLTTLYPSTSLDAFAFEPCGYSANAVIPSTTNKNTSGYWTIHVTPEQDSSYASFETNVSPLSSGKSLPEIISSVISIFQPGKLSITLFISNQEDNQQQLDQLHQLKLNGFARTDRIAYEFDHYDLVFCHFEQKNTT